MTSRPGAGLPPPDRVARSRPYVSLTPPPPWPGTGQGDWVDRTLRARAPLIRARVWMFYRDQEKTQ